MKKAVILLALLLPGCAMSAAGMAEDEIDLTLTSAKAPDIIAGCVASNLMGFTDSIRLGERHYMVVRKNSFGAPIVRWDFIGGETETRVELRSSLPVNHGTDDVRRCL